MSKFESDVEYANRLVDEIAALESKLKIAVEALDELVCKYCTGYENCDLDRYHQILENLKGEGQNDHATSAVCQHSWIAASESNSQKMNCPKCGATALAAEDEKK